MGPDFLAQCHAYGDHLITAHVFWLWLKDHYGIWDFRLNLGLFGQITLWCQAI